MANLDHIAILSRGVDYWNKWRKANPTIIPDLSEFDLSQACLNQVNFNKSNLISANIRQAELNGADLSESILNKCDFYGATLIRADLSKTYLTGADFSETDLRQASLYKTTLIKTEFSYANLRDTDIRSSDFGLTNLVETDLEGADLSGSGMASAVLANIDFQNVKGLETITHRAPSTVGIDTIRKSNGKIPIEFLRGCGLTDIDIEYAKLSTRGLGAKEVTDIIYRIHDLYRGGGSIMFYSLFISYSSMDKNFAEKLHDDLQSSGIRCWFAPHDIQSGRKIYEQIDTAIKYHDRLLLILSHDSMNSEWVKTEIANARAKESEQKRQVLFPIRLVDFETIRKWKCFDADTGKDTAREIREYFIPDFSNWQDEYAYQEVFSLLVRDLKTSQDAELE